MDNIKVKGEFLSIMESTKTSKPKASGRQSEDTAQQTRQRIVQSACLIFAAHGFEGVSLRDIATQAGVAHGLLRHHFGSKEDIWRAVIDSTLEEHLAVLVPLVNEAMNQQTTPLAALKATVRSLIQWMAERPDIPRLLLHESVVGGPRLEYFMAQIAPIRGLTAPLIRAVQQDGLLQQFSHESFLLFLLLLGALPFALSGFTNQLYNADIFAPEQIESHIERVIQTLFSTP